METGTGCFLPLRRRKWKFDIRPGHGGGGRAYENLRPRSGQMCETVLLESDRHQVVRNRRRLAHNCCVASNRTDVADDYVVPRC